MPSTKLMIALLGVSIVLGLIGAMGVTLYLDNQTKAFYVLRASRDIPAKKPVETGDLESVAVPKGFASFSELVVKKSDADLIIGKTSEDDIRKGDVLLYSQFDPLKAKREFLNMKPEDRAYTVPVNAQSAVANMIEPGDYVDIIGTFRPELERMRPPIPEAVASRLSAQFGADQGQGVDPAKIGAFLKDLGAGKVPESENPSPRVRPQTGEEDLPTSMYSLTILRDVYVLGVGQRFTDRRYVVTNPEAMARTAYDSITLRVSPLDAEILTFAQSMGGRLTFTLRPDNATDPKEVTRVDLDTFNRLVEERSTSGPAPKTDGSQTKSPGTKSPADVNAKS